MSWPRSIPQGHPTGRDRCLLWRDIAPDQVRRRSDGDVLETSGGLADQFVEQALLLRVFGR